MSGGWMGPAAFIETLTETGGAYAVSNQGELWVRFAPDTDRVTLWRLKACSGVPDRAAQIVAHIHRQSLITPLAAGDVDAC